MPQIHTSNAACPIPQVSELRRWVEEVEEYCTDGIFSYTLDEAEKLQPPAENLRDEYEDKVDMSFCYKN